MKTVAETVVHIAMIVWLLFFFCGGPLFMYNHFFMMQPVPSSVLFTPNTRHRIVCLPVMMLLHPGVRLCHHRTDAAPSCDVDLGGDCARGV